MSEQFTEYAIRVTLSGHVARITPYATYPRDAIRGYDHAVELYGVEAVEFLQRTVRRTEWVAGKLPPAPGLPPDPDGGLCDPIFHEKPVRDVATGGLL